MCVCLCVTAVGDLKRFSTVTDHHEAKHGFDCALFTQDSRPHCVKARYSLCEVTPVGALRGADPYRKDGLRSSNLFKFWPVVLKEHHNKTPDLNVNRKQVCQIYAIIVCGLWLLQTLSLCLPSKTDCGC